MIAFEYRPTVSLQEGINAVAMFNNIRLQRAMNKIAIGSQFGDKSAIAQGLKELGLNEIAKRYTTEGASEFSDETIDKEIGKEIATKAALEEYAKTYGRRGTGELYSDIEKYKGLAEKEAIARGVDKSKLHEDENVRNYEKMRLGVLTEFFTPELTKDKQLTDALVKDTLREAEKYREQLMKQEISGITSIEPKRMKEITKELKLDRLSMKALQDPENIEKIVYAAPNQSEALARLGVIAKTLFSRQGGLSPANVAMLTKVEEGLARLYGQEYRPSFNWAAMLKQTQGGGGGKLEDFTVITPKGVVEQIAAPNIEEAQKRALQKYKNAFVVKGDIEEATRMWNNMLNQFIENKAVHESAGIRFEEVKEGGIPLFWWRVGGEKKLRALDKEGKVLTAEDIKRAAFNYYANYAEQGFDEDSDFSGFAKSKEDVEIFRKDRASINAGKKSK